MSNQKTQCPSCHTVYPLPPSKLGDDKACATCKKCNTPFYVNQHLISSTQTTAPQTNPKPAQSRPKQKAANKVANEDLIHDDMGIEEDSGDFVICDDELDSFMKQETVIAPAQVTAATAKDSGRQTAADSDEAWLDDLLKNDDSPDIPVAVTSRPNDDLSDFFGEDIITAIPEEKIEESPEMIRQKMQARLANISPTQEQMVKQRSTGYYILWGIGILLMIVLAAAQYTLFNRHLIAKNPQYASLLSALCPSCHIPSANPTAFSTAYTLQTGEADFTTNMIASITNQSPTTQVFPNIKVTVQSEGGVIGELALAPSEYLEVVQEEIGSGQQTRFMLTLDLAPNEIKAIAIEPFY